MGAPSKADIFASFKTKVADGSYPGLSMAMFDALVDAAQYIDSSSQPVGKKGTSGAYFGLGLGYTSDTAQAVGFVANVNSTTVTTAIQAGGFVAGIAATSNPTVQVASTDNLAGGDIIQVSGSKTNDGFYEVMDVLLPRRACG